MYEHFGCEMIYCLKHELGFLTFFTVISKTITSFLRFQKKYFMLDGEKDR